MIVNERTSSVFKVLVWIIPVVFGAGGIVMSLNRAVSDVAEVEAAIERLKEDVVDHARDGVGHPGTRARLKRIETNQQQIIDRQQETFQSLGAICSATGARCP